MAKNITLGALGLLCIILSLVSFGIISFTGPRAYDPEIINNLTTSNTTPGTIVSWPLATGKAMVIRVTFVGKSGNDIFNASKRACIYNQAGTLRIIGGTVEDLVVPVQDAGLATASCNISTSGGNVIATVTGISGTVNWSTNTVIQIF